MWSGAGGSETLTWEDAILKQSAKSLVLYIFLFKVHKKFTLQVMLMYNLHAFWKKNQIKRTRMHIKTENISECILIPPFHLLNGSSLPPYPLQEPALAHWVHPSFTLLMYVYTPWLHGPVCLFRSGLRFYF